MLRIFSGSDLEPGHQKCPSCGAVMKPSDTMTVACENGHDRVTFTQFTGYLSQSNTVGADWKRRGYDVTEFKGGYAIERQRFI